MNSGKANNAAVRLLLWSVAALAGFFLAAWIGRALGAFVLAHPSPFIALWAAFLVAVLYLSRDPDPIEPSDLNAIVSPSYGKVDVIEETRDIEFMKGACRRVSIRVSLADVQVQYAPVSGTVARFVHDHAARERGILLENVFIGLDVVGHADTQVSVRLVGGAWGKRVVPWIKAGDVLPRSARIAMTRPGARVDLYLPSTVKLHVNVGDEVAGGQSVVAKFE